MPIIQESLPDQNGMQQMSHDEDAESEWALEPFRVCKQKLQEEDRYLHTALHGFSLIPSIPKVRKVLGLDDGGPAMCATVEWAAGVADAGYPLLFSHTVVGVWTAIEVLSEDFAIAWLRNKPEAWRVKGVSELDVRLGE